MARTRPTIVDVARRAGVSKGSVSFALNGRPGVAAETAERIHAAAAELGWRPSHRARSLSVSRAFAFGMVVARPPELLGADPFFPTFIAGVETVLAARGYSLVLQVVPGVDAEVAGYRRLAADGRVDGVFLSDLRHADFRVPLLSQVGLPAVTLNRPDVDSPFPAICVDDRPGVAQAVRHLVSLGHRHIAHVAGPAEFLHGSGRQAAWSEALAAADVVRGPIVASDFSAAGGAAATRALLAEPDPPTAIVYANDLMTLAGATVAHDMGFDVPARLSVTGFDDSELAAHVHPPLTTVRTDVLTWGRTAAEVLLALVEGEGAGDVQLPDSSLIVRSSTGPVPTTSRRRRTPDRPTPPTRSLRTEPQ